MSDSASRTVSESGDEHPASKKQKRSRSGCLTCRSDKKKCDEAHPRCARCSKLQYDCVWPTTSNEKASKRWRPAPRRVLLSSTTVSADVPAGITSPEPATVTQSLDDVSHLLQEHWVPQLEPSQAVLSEAELFELLNSFPSLAGGSGLDEPSWQNTALYGLSNVATCGNLPLDLAPPDYIDATQPQSDQVPVSRAQLKDVAKKLPRAVYALIERVLAEQDGKPEAVLPLSYLVNMGLWLDRAVLEALIGHMQEVYSEDSRLRQIIDDVDLSGLGLGANPRPPSKEVISPAEIVALPNVSIEGKMAALMDLSYRHFCVSGVSSFYSTITVIEKFLYTSLRPNKAINIGMLNSPKHYGMACFIYADICRSVCLGYPTAFPYVFQPASTGILTGTEYLNGSSDIMLSLLADTSNFKFLLERDSISRHTDGTLAELYQARADAILSGIRAFKPYSLAQQEANEDDSLLHVSAVTVQEIYRQASLIHFYQSIYRFSASHPSLQKCMKQIFQLSNVLKMVAAHRPSGLIHLPTFLAATVAQEPADREEAMRLLAGFQAVQGFVQNRTLIERIWTDSDKAGTQVDWHDYASEQAGPAFV